MTRPPPKRTLIRHGVLPSLAFLVVPMPSRKLLPLLLLVQTWLASVALADVPFDWLDVRRRGAEAIAEMARQKTAEKPWQRIYKAQVPAGHPMAGLKIAVARAYVAGHARLNVHVVAGPAQLVGTGVVMDGPKAFIHAVGEKTKPLPQETLFREQPVLGVPWIVFCSLEWGPQYTPAIEGEFDQVAVLRLTPRYELGVTARAGKISVSKVYGYVISSAINDGKGNKLGEIDWLAFDDAGIPAEFQLRGAGENAPPVHFVADGAVTQPGKTAFTAAALK